MGESKIGLEALVGLIDQADERNTTTATERTNLDVLPLSNFLNSLGMKYLVVLVFVAAILAVMTQSLSSGGSLSPSNTIANTITLSTILLALAFIAFVIHTVFSGENFQFLSLAASASIIFFLAALAISVRGTLSGNAGFHVLQVLLPLIASLVIGVVFSAFVKIAQKLIAG